MPWALHFNQWTPFFHTHFQRKGGLTMAVFRVEKTKDFTIMCNHHLRNTELSLKAKGLLSLMEIEDKRTV